LSFSGQLAGDHASLVRIFLTRNFLSGTEADSDCRSVA
jgi:hypothetical protein